MRDTSRLMGTRPQDNTVTTSGEHLQELNK